ncbi:pentatricopeptide repeat-containing protein At3g61520, mitochondrial-like [Rosa rugosa]|uniref:pentatricopeptide repeat-containing protein At3g61520, mitochondrial-like n=1 Tax=Rosa rugosa TaxID=74645 RepID=UPI002B401EB4|nr:pentatricopeptide repeat-containing protein At3g61520, mitochondrial-like [Rosa rugosa]
MAKRTNHLCTNPNSDPNQPPQDDDSLITQVLRPNEKDWNFDQLHTLLFPNSTSPSPHSLFLITRRLDAPSKALKFFNYVSENVAGTPRGSKALLSSAFQALLELTLREPTSKKKLFELYKMAKDRNVPLNLKAAGLIVLSMGAAGMEDEALTVFNELHLGLKTTHIRNVVIGMLLKIGRVDDALKVLDEMLHPGPEAKFRVPAMLNRKVGIAWDVLHDVMKMGGAVEASSCNALLTALGRGNDFKRMSELMAKMEEMGIKPDVITFGILINLLCKSRRIDATLEVFEKMSGGVKGVSAEPDVIVYNTLIDGLCKVGRQEEGLRLWIPICLFVIERRDE